MFFLKLLYFFIILSALSVELASELANCFPLSLESIHQISSQCNFFLNSFFKLQDILLKIITLNLKISAIYFIAF